MCFHTEKKKLQRTRQVSTNTRIRGICSSVPIHVKFFEGSRNAHSIFYRYSKRSQKRQQTETRLTLEVQKEVTEKVSLLLEDEKERRREGLYYQSTDLATVRCCDGWLSRRRRGHTAAAGERRGNKGRCQTKPSSTFTEPYASAQELLQATVYTWFVGESSIWGLKQRGTATPTQVHN